MQPYSSCKEINYGTKRSHALMTQRQTKVHKQKVSTILTTTSVLPPAPVPTQSAPKGPELMRERVRLPVPVFQRNS